MPNENDLIKRSAELQSEEIEASLAIETDKILLAKEDNTFKEARLFSQRQISDFKLQQAENPSDDPTGAVEQFSNDLTSSLKDRFTEMGDLNSDVLKTDIHANVNGLRLGAIEKAKTLEKEKSKELSASLISDIEDAATSGDLGSIGSKFKDLTSHLEDMKVQGFISGEKAIEVQQALRNKVYKSQGDEILTSANVLYSEGDPETALEYLKQGFKSLEGAPVSVRKAISNQIKSISKEINKLNNGGVDSSKERFNTVRSNFLKNPKYMKNLVFETKRHIEALERARTPKNSEKTDREIQKTTAQHDVANLFNGNPKLLASTVDVNKLIDVLDKGAVDKNSAYWASFVNEIYTYKSIFNTETIDGARKLKEREDLIAESGGEDVSRDIASSAMAQSEITDPSKYVQGKPPEVGQVFDYVKDEIIESKKVHDLYDPGSGVKTLSLSQKAEANVIDMIGKFILSGDIDSASNMIGYLNDNDITLRQSVPDSIFSTQGSFASILRQVSQFKNTPSKESAALVDNSMRGLQLLTVKEESKEKANSVSIYNSALKAIKSDGELMRSIKDVASDVDGGAKFLAMAILGHVKDNIGLKDFLPNGASIKELMGRSEELEDMIDEYKDSVVRIGDSMVVRRDGAFDQGILGSLGFAADDTAGYGAEVLSNGLNAPGPFSLQSQSGLNRVTDLNVKSSLLSLIRIAYPNEDFSVRSLEKGNFLFKEQENGNVVLFRANEDGSPARPVQINGKPIFTTRKRLADYTTYLKGLEHDGMFSEKGFTKDNKGIISENIFLEKGRKIRGFLGFLILREKFLGFKGGEFLSQLAVSKFSKNKKKDKPHPSMFNPESFLFGMSIDDEVKDALADSDVIKNSNKEVEAYFKDGPFKYAAYKFKNVVSDNKNVQEFVQTLKDNNPLESVVPKAGASVFSNLTSEDRDALSIDLSGRYVPKKDRSRLERIAKFTGDKAEDIAYVMHSLDTEMDANRYEVIKKNTDNIPSEDKTKYRDQGIYKEVYNYYKTKDLTHFRADVLSLYWSKFYTDIGEPDRDPNFRGYREEPFLKGRDVSLYRRYQEQHIKTKKVKDKETGFIKEVLIPRAGASVFSNETAADRKAIKEDLAGRVVPKKDRSYLKRISKLTGGSEDDLGYTKYELDIEKDSRRYDAIKKNIDTVPDKDRQRYRKQEVYKEIYKYYKHQDLSHFRADVLSLFWSRFYTDFEKRDKIPNFRGPSEFPTAKGRDVSFYKRKGVK